MFPGDVFTSTLNLADKYDFVEHATQEELERYLETQVNISRIGYGMPKKWDEIKYPTVDVPKPYLKIFDDDSVGWNFSNCWKGKTVFIIGGGYSLYDFDFNKLEGHHVIACNDGYKLGAGIAPVCIFGDFFWYKLHAERDVLDMYKGMVTTPAENFVENRSLCMDAFTHKFVHYLAYSGKVEQGGSCVWPRNVGISAIHLACILGATRVILLGFDGSIVKGNMSEHMNWYDTIKRLDRLEYFSTDIDEHMKDLWTAEEKSRVVKDLLSVYSDVEIINANIDSELEYFPKMEREEALCQFMR